MSKLVNSVFLVSGMAIGSGLISLPISAARLGMKLTITIVLITFFIAYKTSCLTIDLMKKQGRALSIVELSNEISGKRARTISMISLYLLSLALLCAYFAGTTSIVSSFFSLDEKIATIICTVFYAIFFLIRTKTFNRINSSMVFVLLTLIVCVIFSLSPDIIEQNAIQNDFSAIMPFLPIIFTSFGVQNACPYIVSQIGLNNIKTIKKAFFIGILIPAIVYVLWIYATLSKIYSSDIDLYREILAGKINVGIFIKALCESVPFKFETFLFEGLSLLAILTSAAGTCIGLISSLKETTIGKRKSIIAMVTVGIPAISTLLLANAFMRILSFGGMIATIFVIFMPVYLESKFGRIKPANIFCIIFGVLVVVSELFM